jgi:hypothetical protein
MLTQSLLNAHAVAVLGPATDKIGERSANVDRNDEPAKPSPPSRRIARRGFTSQPGNGFSGYLDAALLEPRRPIRKAESGASGPSRGRGIGVWSGLLALPS